MYAIIKTGAKQYRVEKDAVIDVELLNAEIGSIVEFSDVLFVNNGSEALVGEPNVPNFIVKGEVIGSAVGPKIVSMKYKPRKNRRKKWGHRQQYSRVKILDLGGATAKKPKAAAKKTEEAVEEKPKAAAKKKTEATAEDKPKAAAKPKTAEKKEAEAATEKPKAAPKKKAEAKVKTATKSKSKKEENE